MQVSPVPLLCGLAAAPTKSVENASGQRAIIIVKMVAARDANDLCLSREKRACAVVFVGAVETLNHRRVDRHERWFGWQRVLVRGRAKPAGDSDFEIGRRGESQE
jgi:hypothetical protein